jgi:uncharacterized membrane protein
MYVQIAFLTGHAIGIELKPVVPYIAVLALAYPVASFFGINRLALWWVLAVMPMGWH